MKKVGIIDYQLGNLFSVIQACQKVGINAVLCSEASQLINLDGYILPGVGSFGEAMNNMQSSGLDIALKAEVANGKPLFGICLGLQLLFEKSEESEDATGLGILKGRVKKFPNGNEASVKIRVPNIGWNSLEFTNGVERRKDNPLSEVSEDDYFYFVHSYFIETDEMDCILTNTHYHGIKYASSVFQNNIFATQFHPEKSGEKGLDIYRNWSNLINQE